MGRLILLANTQPSAPKTLPPGGADNISGEPKAENSRRTKTARERSLENEASTTAIYNSILSDLYGDEVEKLRGAMKTEEALRSSREELREISRQLLTTQERERQRIAADLHDGIGQSLSLIKLSLELAMRQIKAGETKDAVELMQTLTLKIKETMGELHRTTMDLHPPMLEDLGIIPTLSWFFREFESAWPDGKVEKYIDIGECDVSGPLKATIFRILQEAMNNVVKHAGAARIRVYLKKTDGMLQLSIEDNGRGFETAGASMRRDRQRGFGLFTMKERARSTGGTFDMQSTSASGTRISISWRLSDGTDLAESLHTQNLSNGCGRWASIQIQE